MTETVAMMADIDNRDGRNNADVDNNNGHDDG
jgi:hypothetical protein